MKRLSLIFALLLTTELMAENDKKLNLNPEILGDVMEELQFIEVGAVYKHYSGKLYKVIAIAHDSEDPSLMRVIYQGLYDCPTFGKNPVWDRPYRMFAENVTINNQLVARFEKIDTEVELK